MTFLNFTIQDPSPLIQYSNGQWVEGTIANDSSALNYSDGSFTVTSLEDATATLVFIGNSITIYGAKRPNHGNYSVRLDNKPALIGDGNGDQIFQFPLWSAQNLTYEQHTAVLTNTPTSSTRNYLDVDFMSIGREIGPPNYTGPVFNVTIDDESPFFIYNGSWSPNFSSTAVNSSLHATEETGASVSLNFQGSSIELYGLYANAPFRVQVDDQLPRTLQGPNVDLNEQQQHAQTLLYYMDGLDENKTHTVTLTNVFFNLGRPLYFDYAVVWSSQEFFNNTPSPNPEFTVSTPTLTSEGPTSTSSSIPSLSTSQSRPFPVGNVVSYTVGGLGGFIILTFVGFILFRRLRRKTSAGKAIRQSNIVNHETPVGETDESSVNTLTSNLNSDSSSTDVYSYSVDICSRSHTRSNIDSYAV